MKTASVMRAETKENRQQELETLIEKRARDGYFEFLTTNHWHCMLIIDFEQLLINNGYKIHKEGRAITVSWEDK